MQEQASLSLSSEEASRIANVDRACLFDILSNASVLTKMIGDLYYARRGKVHNVRVEKESIVLEKDGGRFVVVFNVNYTQGCQDLSYDENEKLTIVFKIDLAKHRLEFETEFIPERGPDEF